MDSYKKRNGTKIMLHKRNVTKKECYKKGMLQKRNVTKKKCYKNNVTKKECYKNNVLLKGQSHKIKKWFFGLKGKKKYKV